MENYTIYCTEEQTKKALELDAPLQEHPFEASIIKAYEKMFPNLVYTNDRYYCLPTAEQMIGWLEEQKDINFIIIDNNYDDWWYYNINTIDDTVHLMDLYCRTRKGATLAAIDVALDYLINKKEK